MDEKKTGEISGVYEPLITIIVPVYQTKPYLCRCVYSLLKQTWKNLEILLVDDGSTDGSGEICEQLRQEDGRLRVIHQENGGLSCARNAGLREAAGRYVGFVDSDDRVEPAMYMELVQAAECHDADLVMCDHKRMLKNGDVREVTTSLAAGVYDRDALKKSLYPALLMGADLNYGPLLQVWNCLYRRSFLEQYGLRFEPEIRWSEDNLFNAQAGYHARRFVYLKEKFFYQYYENPGSITTGYRPGAWNVYKRMNQCLRQEFQETEDFDFTQQLNWHLLYYACNVIGMECACAKTRREAHEQIGNILSDKRLLEVFQQTQLDISWKLRVQLWLMKHQSCVLLLLMYSHKKNFRERYNIERHSYSV